VDDDNAFSSRGQVNGTSDAVLPLHAHLPEFPVEVLDMRFVHSGDPILFDELYDAEKPLSHVLGHSIELPLHSPIQDFDTPTHLVSDISQIRLRPANEKGGRSVYGLGRFPVALHKEQWAMLLDLADDEDTAQPTDGSRRHWARRMRMNHAY